MDDLKRADKVVIASINELTERRGFGKMASSHPPNFQAFSQRDDAEGLWIADDDGEITGFAWSWVCGEFWFLAQLFGSPGRQSDGIGNQLISKTFAHAQNARDIHQSADYFHVQQRVPLDHSYSIVLSDENTLKSKRKLFLHTTKHRLTDPSKISASDFAREFPRFENSLFRRLSASIGRLVRTSGRILASPSGKKRPSAPTLINWDEIAPWIKVP